MAQANNYQSIHKLKQQINVELNEGFSLSPKISKKNAGLAVLYSLLLPGMGELYAGNYSSGQYFTISEGILWGAYFGIKTYGLNQQDNYKALASLKAGVNPEGKKDKFWGDISSFIDVESFNREQDLNRDFENVYDTQTHYWDWKNNSARKEYRNMWVSSEQALNNVRFVVWGMLINRVVSAINAVRLVVKHNKQMNNEVVWDVSVGVVQMPDMPTGLKLNFNTRF